MKKDVKQKQTTAERLETLKQQREQAKELFLKLSGAIEILELIEQEK